jgi:pyruvate dehydrogenase phosphatase
VLSSRIIGISTQFPLDPAATAPMHRALARVSRSTHHITSSASASAHRNIAAHLNNPRRTFLFTSKASSRPLQEPSAAHAHEPLKSSMYFRRLPVALVSSIVVGYGAWYSYNTTNIPSSPAAAARSFTSTATNPDALPTRTVLVVGADEIRQGTIVGDAPISKETSESGHRIVEMLTADQSTDKLRKLEKSFSVNRGQGVTRYDLVQLPSNDPIEDDHAEKIVDFPSRAATGDQGKSDWMFWGVFDGHS